MSKAAVKFNTEGPTTSLEVASIFAELSHQQSGKVCVDISMLHKLTYIAHGFHLSIHNISLVFDEMTFDENGAPLFQELSKIDGAKDLPKCNLSVSAESYELLEVIFYTFVVFGNFSYEELDYYSRDIPSNEECISNEDIKLRFDAERLKNGPAPKNNISSLF